MSSTGSRQPHFNNCFSEQLTAQFRPLASASFGFEQAGHLTHISLFGNPFYQLCLRTIPCPNRCGEAPFCFEQGG
jgi:hypothetical protein